jgi:hypothetical protein
MRGDDEGGTRGGRLSLAGAVEALGASKAALGPAPASLRARHCSGARLVAERALALALGTATTKQSGRFKLQL